MRVERIYTPLSLFTTSAETRFTFTFSTLALFYWLSSSFLFTTKGFAEWNSATL